MDRFQKQIGLPGFSINEQEKLKNAKILVVGAGGLGCPVLLYLASMGAGTIGIIDGDTISLSNLNRQVLYGINDIGKLKAAFASEYIKTKYNDLTICAYTAFITSQNALDLISDYDLVLDCTDNFASRYLLNDACVLCKKPLVFGAIYKHAGQVMVFHPNANPYLNYRHVYPIPPSPEEIPDCNTTGVLGVLPGLIGLFMATEAIKVITGFGEPLINKIMYYDITDNSRFITEISKNPEANKHLPLSKKEFINQNYNFNCTSAVATITWTQVLNELSENNNKLTLVDVREPSELPECSLPSVLSYPLSDILNYVEKEIKHDTVYIFCKSGTRSKKAVILLKEKFPEKNILSIEGGILSTDAPVKQKLYETT